MKKKDIILILILTAVLACAWVIFTVLHNISSSTINETLTKQIVPIPKTFDTKTIDLLKQRQQVNPQYAMSSQSAAPIVITPTVTPIPTLTIATTSAQTATRGGATR